MLATDPAQFPSRNWLPLEVTTIAEALKPLGYYSAFMGKWHLGSEPWHPIHQGFDEQRGVSNFGHPRHYYQPFFVEGANPYAETPGGKYLTDRLADDAMDFLKNYRRTEPFLLTVFFYNVHSPHEGRKDLVAKYEKRGLQGREAQYGAMVEAMDDNVGRILRTLEEQGQANDTVVVFFSDQGGYFTQAPLRGGKTGGMALYEGGAKVPLAVRWPGKTKAGSKSDALVMSTDLFPTFVEMAGGDPAGFEPLDGVSITPLLTGSGSIGREELYLYRNYEAKYAAVVGEEWKVIASLDGNHELYNLKRDPWEKDNLADRNPAKVGELLSRLETWKKHVGVDPKMVLK